MSVCSRIFWIKGTEAQIFVRLSLSPLLLTEESSMQTSIVLFHQGTWDVKLQKPVPKGLLVNHVMPNLSGIGLFERKGEAICPLKLATVNHSNVMLVSHLCRRACSQENGLSFLVCVQPRSVNTVSTDCKVVGQFPFVSFRLHLPSATPCLVIKVVSQ